jgi:hypothetical protein
LEYWQDSWSSRYWPLFFHAEPTRPIDVTIVFLCFGSYISSAILLTFEERSLELVASLGAGVIRVTYGLVLQLSPYDLAVQRLRFRGKLKDLEKRHAGFIKMTDHGIVPLTKVQEMQSFLEKQLNANVSWWPLHPPPIQCLPEES